MHRNAGDGATASQWGCTLRGPDGPKDTISLRAGYRAAVTFCVRVMRVTARLPLDRSISTPACTGRPITWTAAGSNPRACRTRCCSALSCTSDTAHSMEAHAADCHDVLLQRAVHSEGWCLRKGFLLSIRVLKECPCSRLRTRCCLCVQVVERVAPSAPGPPSGGRYPPGLAPCWRSHPMAGGCAAARHEQPQHAAPCSTAQRHVHHR